MPRRIRRAAELRRLRRVARILRRSESELRRIGRDFDPELAFVEMWRQLDLQPTMGATGPSDAEIDALRRLAMTLFFCQPMREVMAAIEGLRARIQTDWLEAVQTAIRDLE